LGMMGQTACKPGSVPPGHARTRRPFLWTAPRDAVLATYPDASGQRRPYPPVSSYEDAAGAESLFGLAPGGACHAVPVARSAVGSYPTLSPLPPRRGAGGGLLSVALSLGSPPAGVARRRIAVEPGLSSPPLAEKGDRPAIWPAAKVAKGGGRVKRVQETDDLPPLGEVSAKPTKGASQLRDDLIQYRQRITQNLVRRYPQHPDPPLLLARRRDARPGPASRRDYAPSRRLRSLHSKPRNRSPGHRGRSGAGGETGRPPLSCAGRSITALRARTSLREACERYGRWVSGPPLAKLSASGPLRPLRGHFPQRGKI